MPGQLLVHPGGQRHYVCQPDRSLGPYLAIESVAEVLDALASLPLGFSC